MEDQLKAALERVLAMPVTPERENVRINIEAQLAGTHACYIEAGHLEIDLLDLERRFKRD